MTTWMMMRMMTITITTMLLMLFATVSCVVAVPVVGGAGGGGLIDQNTDMLLDDEKSNLSRAMVSMGAKSTTPPISTNDDDPSVLLRRRRSTYPQSNPHICLAFLSCCDRTDLLNHTLAGAIRHMEEDEPSYLRYEIAWVDNGSDPDKTTYIKETYQIEHALTLSKNMGLAYGMNLLIQNLCTAPYILLLEEDWLYLDELVAPQTVERKRSIATSIALLENIQRNQVTAYDGRTVMGVFLRHETYETFLTFPHADIWERRENVNLVLELESATAATTATITTDNNNNNKSCDSPSVTPETAAPTEAAPPGSIADIDYRIFCADTGIKGDSIWGSYTNGAGLYRRTNLIQTGRMYGEPGDAFHDRYVEGNFAFRVALQNCHAAVRLTADETCTVIHDPQCTGSFHHIGGGRGTRPRTAQGTMCDGLEWNFFGTPLYSKFQRYVSQATGEPIQRCSREELMELRDRRFRDRDAEEYREQVRKENEEVFKREAEERQKLRDQARIVRTMLQNDPETLRMGVPWMRDMSDEDIIAKATRMERLADSAHPMDGFWDLHGRIRT
jgi:hypothetical protein